jgi:hypothetical protein
MKEKHLHFYLSVSLSLSLLIVFIVEKLINPIKRINPLLTGNTLLPFQDVTRPKVVAHSDVVIDVVM